MAGLELKRLEDFDAYRVNFRGFGFKGVGVAGQTTNIDFLIADERLIYGGQAIVKNHVIGDSISMQIIYKAGGIDTVLGEFITDWQLADDKQQQDAIMVAYPTKVSTGLYFRIIYKSIGATNVDVCINTFAVKNMTGL